MTWSWTDPQINSGTSYRVIEGSNICSVELTCSLRRLTLCCGRHEPGSLCLCSLRWWDIGLIVAI